MINWLMIGFTSLMATQAFADECSYKSPTVIDLPYHEGAYIPVYFSNYQFNLPSRPDALLSDEGFLASYPERGYIGQQHVDFTPWRKGAAHGNLPTGVADAYRVLYGATSTENLNQDASAEILFQRVLLKLNCNAQVKLYRVGGAVDVIWQERDSEDGFHKIWVLGDERAELITMRRPNEVVLQLISSIKKRR
jgi:hypothetical protein